MKKLKIKLVKDMKRKYMANKMNKLLQDESSKTLPNWDQISGKTIVDTFQKSQNISIESILAKRKLRKTHSRSFQIMQRRNFI